MTPEPLLPAVGRAVGARQHGLVGQVTAQVVGQGARAVVAFCRVLLQRFQDDGVQVALQGIGDLQRRQPACWAAVARPPAPTCSRRTREPPSTRVRAPANQQFEQNHAERIDVGGGADGLPGNLFGRGVLWREGAAGLAGECRLGRTVSLHQLGDAEVQQPHLARLVHQDVAGLEVAVHHQVGVRMGHGVADLHEQRQALAQRRRPHCAPSVQGLSVHPFQRQVGLAGGRDAGVVQARNVRVFQRGQDLALARQALGQAGAAPGAVRQLQGHLPALQLVGALGQPDAGHAPFAQAAQQPVGAHHGASLVGGFGGVLQS